LFVSFLPDIAMSGLVLSQCQLDNFITRKRVTAI
jgi:hypothetical protein